MKKILFLLAILFALVVGCGTRAYKTTAVVAVTADHAVDGWLDYWVAARRLPGADVARLDQQDAAVEAAYEKYQAAMEVVYQTRKAAVQPDLLAALKASSAASQAVINLVFQFLPPDRAAQLKASSP